MNPFLRSPKSVAITGAVLLWIVFPVMTALLVKVGASAAAHGPVPWWGVLLLVAGALVAGAVMLVGFAYLLIALWLAYRIRTGQPAVRAETTASDPQARRELLRDIADARGRERPESAPTGVAADTSERD